MKKGALVLAAGNSRRFQGHKLSALLQGEPLLFLTLKSIADVIDDICLVYDKRDSIIASLIQGSPLQVNSLAICPSTPAMSESIKCGVQHCQDWDAWLICLADMPLIEPPTFKKLYNAMDRDRIIQPTYNGQPGHPVAFGQQFQSELLQLSGDRGAKPVIENNKQHLYRIEIDDPHILCDIDTPQDLHVIQERNQSDSQNK